MNTHNVKIEFGKHRGSLITRVPLSYLKWMINENTMQADLAKAEFERRGDSMPKIELSNHAVNRASTVTRNIWLSENSNEGIISWLERKTLAALELGKKQDDKYFYEGMVFVIHSGEEYPVLKTVMRAKK